MPRALERLDNPGHSLFRGLVDRFYSGVSRYTTSGFLRMKLGEALERRGVAPHIFESASEAQLDLRTLEREAPE
jgi:propionate CoA-transferase